MFDKKELEQAQYDLAQHYLTRLKTYSGLYETTNQAHIATYQFEVDKSQIEHSLNWAANMPTDEAAELYLALNEVGSSLFADHQSFDKRLAQQEIALRLAHKLNKTDAMAFHLMRLGTLYRDLAKYEEARSYLQEALKLALAFETQSFMADCYNELGIVARRLGHQQEAWDLTQQALVVARTIKDDFRIARFSRSLSTIAYEMGDLDAAINLARESLAIFENIGTPREIAQVAYTLGSYLLMTPDSQLEEARKFLWQSYHLFDQIGNKRMLASVACNLSSDLIKNQGDYVSATQLAQDALDTYRKLNYSLGICNALTILGDAAVKQEQLDHARQLYSEGLSLAQETKSAWDIIMLSLGLGIVANQSGKFEVAWNYLLKALKVAANGQMEALELLVIVHLSVPIARQAKQVERAVQYLGIVLDHPKSTAVAIAEAKTILIQLEDNFPSQDFAQLLENGKQAQLQKVVEELLNSC